MIRTIEDWKAAESVCVVWLEAHKNESITWQHIDYECALVVIRRELAKAAGSE